MRACSDRYAYDLDYAPVICTLPAGHAGQHEAPINADGWEGSVYVWGIPAEVESATDSIFYGLTSIDDE